MAREDGAPADASRAGPRRLILNPTSGRGDHADEVHALAEERGYPVQETDHRGHAVELTERAVADGVDLLAVCGGDGTVHEVVQGLLGSGALDSVTLGIVPAGTENIVATDVGIRSIADGFEVAEHGETRRLDLGIVGEEPFVMSAIAGLPADVSAAATHELKQRFGPFAFVVGAIREELPFDGVRVAIDADTETGETTWSGDALAVLVGNVRRFSKGGGQANAEDGRLDVSIVERMPSGELMAEAIGQRLLHHDTPHVRNFRATRLDVVGVGEGSMTFSLDGEIREFERAPIRIRPGALRLRVGEAYDPRPENGANGRGNG